MHRFQKCLEVLVPRADIRAASQTQPNFWPQRENQHHRRFRAADPHASHEVVLENRYGAQPNPR